METRPQPAKLGFLEMAHGTRIRSSVRLCEPKTLNLEPTLLATTLSPNKSPYMCFMLLNSRNQGIFRCGMESRQGLSSAKPKDCSSAPTCMHLNLYAT